MIVAVLYFKHSRSMPIVSWIMFPIFPAFASRVDVVLTKWTQLDVEVVHVVLTWYPRVTGLEYVISLLCSRTLSSLPYIVQYVCVYVSMRACMHVCVFMFIMVTQVYTALLNWNCNN